jgi:hypothetical protein
MMFASVAVAAIVLYFNPVHARTQRYDLTISNGMVSPDGFSRL